MSDEPQQPKAKMTPEEKAARIAAAMAAKAAKDAAKAAESGEPAPAASGQAAAPASPARPLGMKVVEAPPAEDTYGLRPRFGAAIEEMVLPRGTMTITVARERILDICRFLKEKKGFDYLVLVGGVDRETHLESVYHLGKSTAPEVICLRTRIPYDDARVASVTPLWQGANWHERESYDLMGIVYEGHPDLRRILLFDEWDDYPHPLRKEFKLQGFEAKFTILE